ncbi:protein arginine methyltransferase 4B isoform X2 [Wolffia australiana]
MNGGKMDSSPGIEKSKLNLLDIPGVLICNVSCSPSDSPAPTTATLRFIVDGAGNPQLQFHREADVGFVSCVDVRTAQLFRLGPGESLCLNSRIAYSYDKESSTSSAITVRFRSESDRKAFHCAFEEWKNVVTDSRLENGIISTFRSKFDEKIEAASAKMYFHYYGQLLHQQNMLQDYVRTGTYYAAVVENRADFEGRIVVDVGAGSGILSLFAAQAGAKHVYAVEASEMAEYAHRLTAGNPSLGERITVVKGKVEEVILPEKADILISEPMGTLLVNERMLESYVIARDRFLTANGKMFPSLGRIHMAPFSDEFLFTEIANKALFWQQKNYFGVDLTPLHDVAFQGYFTQPVVDAFDPRLLIAPALSHTLDFTYIKEEELYEISIPLNFTASVGTRVHGLACWFDVLFNGSSVQRWLTTAPGAPTTHWYQLRCMLSQPLYAMAGQEITGQLRMVAHNAQSYTLYLTMSTKMWGAGAENGAVLQTATGKLDLKEPYYRMSQPQPYVWTQDQNVQQPPNPQGISTQSQDLDSLMPSPTQNPDTMLTQ